MCCSRPEAHPAFAAAAHLQGVALAIGRVLIATAAALFVTACSPGAVQFRIKGTALAPSTTTLLPATASPPTSGSSTGCAYTWASVDLPDLSTVFDAQLKELGSGLSGSAYAFGEDCHHDDGSVAFLPMETDFRARIPVDASTDSAALGAWVRKVLATVDALPQAMIPGSRPGRVEFMFEGRNSGSLRLNIEIQRYRLEAGALDDAQLFSHFSRD